MERTPARRRRSRIQSGTAVRLSTPRRMQPAKRGQAAGASSFTGKRSACPAGARAMPGPVTLVPASAATSRATPKIESTSPRLGVTLRSSTAAGRDPAHTELIRLRMRLGGEDLGHHHAGKRRRSERERLHLDAGHGEPCAELGRPPRNLHPLGEPRVRGFHAPKLPNCRRKRRSFSKKRHKSFTPYRSIASRSMPAPKAEPV